MNTKLNCKWIGSLLILGLVLTGGLYADGHDKECKGHHGKKGSEHHLKMMAKKLGLSKDQVTAIEKIHEASEEDKKSISEKIQKERKDLKELMMADTLDKSKIRSKMEEIAELKVDKKMLWIEDKIQIQKVLTPEQRSKQKELMKKHHEKMKDKHKDHKKKTRD